MTTMMTQKLLLSTIMILFLVMSASTPASRDDASPGASSGGELILGQGEGDPSIDLAPIGGDIALQKGVTNTDQDSISVTADGSWRLTVEDANSATSSYDGKMRRGSLSGVWHYDVSEKSLKENFQIMVQDIGDNNYLPTTINLADATDLSRPCNIVTSSATSTGLSIDLQYSQKAVEADESGAYRIDLTYTLSRNP